AYVLPTEAEWEYACRAGTTTTYSWGDEINTSFANYTSSGNGETVDVGQYQPNPWGFYDMHGNLWEATADRHYTYAEEPVTDPVGTGDGVVSARGGSWNRSGSLLRAADRLTSYDSGRFFAIGFRLALRDMNKAPTDLNSTTTLTIAENQPVGTVVGEFNATDPEGAAVTYSLVSGDGFTLDANGTLKTSWQLDYEAGSVRTIVVQAKDEMNATVEGTFTVTITNVNEAPVMGGTVNLSISESENLFNIPTTWDRTFGGTGEDRLKATIKTSDGGYLLCGYSESNATVDKSQNSRGGQDYWVVKLDELGNKLWDRTYGGSAADSCNGAVEVPGGGYLIYGGSTSPAGGDRT
ncbi:MAG: hypothetical protein EBY48_11575, partial [Opitutae bacterium]|nr:hypothetical protein [Opitutae bacterium]